MTDPRALLSSAIDALASAYPADPDIAPIEAYYYSRGLREAARIVRAAELPVSVVPVSIVPPTRRPPAEHPPDGVIVLGWYGDIPQTVVYDARNHEWLPTAGGWMVWREGNEPDWWTEIEGTTPEVMKGEK